MLRRCKHCGLVAEADEVFGDSAARLVIFDRKRCINHWFRTNVPRGVRGRCDTHKCAQKTSATSQLLPPQEALTKEDNRQNRAGVHFLIISGHRRAHQGCPLFPFGCWGLDLRCVGRGRRDSGSKRGHGPANKLRTISSILLGGPTSAICRPGSSTLKPRALRQDVQPLGRQIDPDAFSKSFTAKAATIKPMRFHALRHTHITHLLRDGVPLHIVSAEPVTPTRPSHSKPI